ncbi:amino acid ABC transporter permease [Gulosibacter molinativorax]|uniref:Amino acid ABC transporter permease n=1 Tax=Gulosibacter molinativorax TaxID=256821 RepID=A0ABT7C9W0_9MICO|nr:amino acid ABC transporter permease [Gulosibacter molinativorax]MDJ1371579.1 amino acid ABC transporter permease [Gulosibacter molinativorax]QUY61078.1 Amino ABC transporter, permease, 3-TM region,His/Glu/Gln/Arg/opine family domain protein [Gulosibacter molinativorax]
MTAIFENFDLVLQGFLMTLRLLAVGAIGAAVIGIVIAFLRISPVPAMRNIATVYTELVRNTPLTLVFFLIIVVLPVLDFGVDSTIGAYIALSVYTSPFIAEALRSGINGVPLGQAEAARSLGFNFGQTVSLIIMPQAMRMVVPPLINVIIALAKNTSVASGFLVVEMVAISKTLANRHGDQVIGILFGIALLYLVITIPLGLIASYVERKVAVLR